jgi:hypothetical protein
MSKFIEDSYGQRREADFSYAGGVKQNPAAGIEKMLLGQGVSRADAAETATAIVNMAEKQKDAPLEKQKEIVKIFVEPLLRDKAQEVVGKVVTAALGMAVAQAAEKNAFSLAPMESENKGAAVRAAPPKVGR